MTHDYTVACRAHAAAENKSAHREAACCLGREPSADSSLEVQRERRREMESERLGEGLSETGKDCMGWRERCCEREGECAGDWTREGVRWSNKQCEGVGEGEHQERSKREIGTPVQRGHEIDSQPLR